MFDSDESDGFAADARPVRGRRAPTAAVLLLGLAAVGCGGREMVATPNLYLNGGENPFVSVPPALRTDSVDVLYVTDRAPEESPVPAERYGIRRSNSIAYGSALVKLGNGATWDELAADSVRAHRSRSYPITVPVVEEKGRFPSAVESLEIRDGKLQLAADAVAKANLEAERFRAEVARRLALTDSKEAVVFVHGIQNTLEYAVGTAGQMWHFAGRRGVPIAYTWPAGGAGLLRGYTYDRESSEFTVFHFKNFLRLLATCPGLEKVKIVSHSRGTGVVASGLVELHIEADARGRTLTQDFKIDTVVMAAPDIDLEVARQRVVSERLFNSVRTFAVYVSNKDSVIGIADTLFRSIRRIGNLVAGDVRPEMLKELAKHPRVQIISCNISGFSGVHDYFYAHPAVLSDLILLVRDGRDPGPENGRPLTRQPNGFWQIGNDYALPAAK